MPVKAGTMAALYLLLIPEICQFTHGCFMVLFWVSVGTYVVAVVACLADEHSVFQKLTTIGWATLGLGLNWVLGFLCAPL